MACVEAPPELSSRAPAVTFCTFSFRPHCAQAGGLAAAYPEGTACEALNTNDLKWYEASVVGHTADGVIVEFKGLDKDAAPPPPGVLPHQIRPTSEAVRRTHLPFSASTLFQTHTRDAFGANRTRSDSGGITRPFCDARSIPPRAIVARTEGNTYAAKVWALSFVQGSLLSPRAKP